MSRKRSPRTSQLTTRTRSPQASAQMVMPRRRLLLAMGAATAGAVAAGPLSGFGGASDLALASQQAPISPIADQSRPRYFAETGHNLSDPFLTIWKRAGEEIGLGLPISEERFDEASGLILQHFETMTLAYSPLDTGAGLWPVTLTPAQQGYFLPSSHRAGQGSCRTMQTDCVLVPGTGHSVSGRFLRFWREWGEAVFLGAPVSEPFADRGTGLTTQIFQNAVLEERPNGVTFRKVGREIAEREALWSTPAFQPAPPNGGKTWLVASSAGLRMRSAPDIDADVIAVLPENAEFIAAAEGEGWVPGYGSGYAGYVASEWLASPPQLPRRAASDWTLNIWQGAALGETNVRARPTTESRMVDELVWGDPVEVSAWVRGEEVFEGANLWAQVGNNRYIYARNVGRNAPVEATPIPADAPTWGNWIDVNLTQQLMIAYEGFQPVRVSVTTTGMAGWETPPGYFFINHRVPNETMTSGAIGAERYFRLENVLFTQYFTDRGHAIHFAWWRTPETIGRPGSHGCLNLLLDDARFFWDWATIGTPVLVHY